MRLKTYNHFKKSIFSFFPVLIWVFIFKILSWLPAIFIFIYLNPTNFQTCLNYIFFPMILNSCKTFWHFKNKFVRRTGFNFGCYSYLIECNCNSTNFNTQLKWKRHFFIITNGLTNICFDFVMIVISNLSLR